MVVIFNKSSHLNLNPKVFLSYFVFCSAEEKQQERAWLGI